MLAKAYSTAGASKAAIAREKAINEKHAGAKSEADHQAAIAHHATSAKIHAAVAAKATDPARKAAHEAAAKHHEARAGHHASQVPHMMQTGPKGGKFVMVNGTKHYIGKAG
jgi:hypothetical protein